MKAYNNALERIDSRMALISTDIERAAHLLRNEDLVAIPTETVYGLAGNIYSASAIKRIFQLKQRPLFNPLIVHTYSFEELHKFVKHIPEAAQRLAKAFWPGSLTLILAKQSIIPDLVTANKLTVGVRIPNHPLTLELLRSLDFPLAAPSANPFGNISPTRATHVANYFPNNLSMVLDGGDCQNVIESTIIGFEDNEPVVYRLGAISIEEIVDVIGPIRIKNKEAFAPQAPGMLARHYAPETTTVLVDDAREFIKSMPGKKIGVVTFNNMIELPNIQHIEVLSKSGDLKEAASRLYASLHKLDHLPLDMIVAEKFPDKDLGKSINDRLIRATKKK